MSRDLVSCFMVVYLAVAKYEVFDIFSRREVDKKEWWMFKHKFVYSSLSLNRAAFVSYGIL